MFSRRNDGGHQGWQGGFGGDGLSATGCGCASPKAGGDDSVHRTSRIVTPHLPGGGVRGGEHPNGWVDLLGRGHGPNGSLRGGANENLGFPAHGDPGDPLADIFGPADGGSSGGAIPGVQGTPCSSTNLVNDGSYIVPAGFYHQTDNPIILASGGAEYYYRCDNRACRWFVVDVLMKPDSNTKNSLIPDLVYIDAGPYDLPSSVGYGDTAPSLKYDCEHLEVHVRHYYRHSPSPGALTTYALMGSLTRKASWSGGGMCIKKDDGYGFPIKVLAPASGTDYHRIAVRVKLRSSGQEAGVFIYEGPPN